MDEPLKPGEAKALREALRDLAAERRGVPFQALMTLAKDVEGRPLTLDLAAAEQIGAPVVVLRAQLEDTPMLAALSRREAEVARLLARGLSNKQIARELGIALGTVKDHVHNVLAKTGLRSRAALAAAMARGRP
jgi:DNA-binding NarL/FixJ family response regulator